MRHIFALLLAILVVGSGVLMPAYARAAAADYDIQNGHFYTQAVAPGTPAGYGHSITDSGTDARGQTILFWTAFKNLGGVQALGYPSSERFMLDGFWTQATQRVLLQWRPELKAVVFVNVFDALHNMGLDQQLLKSKQVPVQVNDNGSCSDSDFNCIMKYRQSWMDSNPTIKNFYFSSNPNPVTYYGLPTSHIDTSNGAFDIIRLQRIVIQYWKVNIPGVATPGMITVGLGGDIAKDQGLVPANVGAPIPPPGSSQNPPPSGLPTFPEKGKIIFGTDIKRTSNDIAIVNPTTSYNAGAVVVFLGYMREPANTDKIVLEVRYNGENGQAVDKLYSEVYDVSPQVQIVYGALQFGGGAKPGTYTFKLKRFDTVLADGTVTLNP